MKDGKNGESIAVNLVRQDVGCIGNQQFAGAWLTAWATKLRVPRKHFRARNDFLSQPLSGYGLVFGNVLSNLD